MIPQEHGANIGVQVLPFSSFSSRNQHSQEFNLIAISYWLFIGDVGSLIGSGNLSFRNWTPLLTRPWMTGEVEPDQLPPRLVSDMTSFSFFVNSKIWCTQIAMKLHETASRRLCTVLGRPTGFFSKQYLGGNIFLAQGKQWQSMAINSNLRNSIVFASSLGLI